MMVGVFDISPPQLQRAAHDRYEKDRASSGSCYGRCQVPLGGMERTMACNMSRLLLLSLQLLIA
jgi:hypothetical protein